MRQPQIAINRRVEELARSGDYLSRSDIEGDLRAVFPPKAPRLEFDSAAFAANRARIGQEQVTRDAGGIPAERE
jgi:hypothetical protein